ncbi:MAG: prolyl oligopeptidase family serine peptidase [Limisphaerales bacterium]
MRPVNSILARLIAAFGAGVSISVPAVPPENLVLDGVPEPTAELREAVEPYLAFRPSTFLDWHPRRRDALISTRSAETPQLHQVRVPLGPRGILTDLPERVTGGSFAPDNGDAIVFSQDRGGNEFYQLYRRDADGGAITLLTDGNSRNTSPLWSGTGRLLAYGTTRRNGRDTDLRVLDPRRPATDRLLLETVGGGWTALDWSPDERRLLVLNRISANRSELHLVDLDGGGRRLLTYGEGDSEPSSTTDGAFLPDGRSILVVTDWGAEHRRLGRMDLDTGSFAPLGPAIPWNVEGFDLSGDGKIVALVTNEDGASVLRWIDAGSGAELGRHDLPLGVVSGVRWHPRRREIGLTLTSARIAGDVFSVNTRVNGRTRWTEGETGGLNLARFAEPERVRVKGFDGLEVSGFLVRPDSRRFPGPRPVVVHIHGGPEGQARPQFLRAWNYLVREMGIALLFPNVRGSEGYGKTFLALDDGFRREDSVKDIGAFLDWIGRQPDLDAHRVAVYGGSYGGYMVLASLVHFGDRLRCGIDVVGISNFRTFLRNTQDYRRDLRRVEYGDEREPRMAEFLESISPMNRLDRIRKPLLVAQGLNDPRVPASESEQLVRALRQQGGTVGYLLAKDEGHGFAKKRNADFLFLSVVGFLERHLLDPGVARPSDSP